MKIWEDERQCYIRAAMEKNSEAENEALKAQLDAIDWSVLEQIERKETVNERGVFAPLEAVETEEIERRRDEFRELGIKAIREGKVGAVLLVILHFINRCFQLRGDRERVSDWTDRREHSISGFTGSCFCFSSSSVT